MTEVRLEALTRQYDYLIQYRQKLSDDGFEKELFRFAILLKNRSESNEYVDAALKSENDNLKSELEALKLYNSTLNSNLKLVYQSLFEEKCQQKNLEYLSEKLCSLLLKYKQRIHLREEMKEKTTRAPDPDSKSPRIESDSDLVLRTDTSASRGDFDENNFSGTDGYTDELLISPTYNFRGRREKFYFYHRSDSSKIIDPNEKLSKVKESDPEVLDRTSKKQCSLLLEYQQPIHQLEKTEETTTQEFCDDSYDSDLVLRIDTSTSEDSFNDSNSSDSCDYHDELPKSYSDFRDDDISERNIESHFAATNSLNKISNSSVFCKSWESAPASNLSYFTTESTSSLTTTTNSPSLQSDLSNIDIDHDIQLEEESYGFNSLINNSKSTVVKKSNALDLMENFVIDPATQESPKSLETNENLVASKNSKADELPNSVTPVQSNFSSEIGGETFSKKSGLVCHKRVPKSMNNSQSFHCEKCGKSFLAKRKGQKLAKCPNCDVRYNTRSHEKQPKLISSSLETKINSKFTDDDKIHTECEKGNSNVRCNICGKSYSNNYTLKKHIRQMHEGKKPYECNACAKRFARKGDLKKHTAVHSSDRPFKCSVCNECFKYSSSKTRHERLVHEGYAPFHCAHCGKGCIHKNNLISHIFAQHFPGIRKQFKCDICDKSFAIRQTLEGHKSVHMSQRPFKCSICDQRFKRHDSKLQHERNIHGESNRFYCAYCEKSYSYKGNLSLHLRKVHV